MDDRPEEILQIRVDNPFSACFNFLPDLAEGILCRSPSEWAGSGALRPKKGPAPKTVRAGRKVLGEHRNCSRSFHDFFPLSSYFRAPPGAKRRDCLSELIRSP